MCLDQNISRPFLGILDTICRVQKPNQNIQNRNFCRYSCTIEDVTSNSLIITGGEGDLRRMRTASIYSYQGWVSDLPMLKVGRWNHGCSSFFKDNVLVNI